MASTKKVVGKKPANKTRPPTVVVEADGEIEITSTFAELKSLAKSSPYSANRAIMRAAISRMNARDLNDSDIVYVSFGMSPPLKPPTD
jgi:hypothetical protein